MKLSRDKCAVLKSITNNYFKNISKIHDIKIYNSEEFVDIILYPESSIILNSIDIEDFSMRLKENIVELKHSSDLIIVEFDVIHKYIKFSISF